MHLPDVAAATLLARLPREVDVAVCRRGDRTFVAVAPEEVVAENGAGARAALDALAPGLWVGWASFELGHAFERVVPRRASQEARAVPDAVFARFGAVATLDGRGNVSIGGEGPGRVLLEGAVERSDERSERGLLPLTTGAWSTSLDRDEFVARVDVILQHLHAGDCYQVNLTRRLTLTADSAFDPVVLYGELARCHPAPHAGMLRLTLPDGPVSVVCASPERFLARRGRVLVTQPIKGTGADAALLRASAKDHAENVMIVDLARNDLGRVCVPGSIAVPSLCTLESHPGLHHLVSTVRGTLASDLGNGTILAATFPPASVTGAPKPRVLQIIEDLEPVRRGVYCGAFGWLDTEHDAADLAVAIRTFTIFDDRAELGVGGGIVADSVATAEWEETELKAARLLAVADACTGALVPT